MERFLHNTRKIIFQKQQDIFSSAIILSVMIVISRFFGFIRYRTLATFFTKEELDIFFAAFRLPDFIFEILITGALSSAFIPMFIKYNKKTGNTLDDNVSSIINFIVITLFVIMSGIFIGAEVIVQFITPGFSEAQINQVVTLSRVLIISQLPFLVLGNILSGIAQANKIFIITAIAPVVYNIGIIVGTIFLSEPFGLYGPMIGVVIGAFLFFFVQLPTVYIVHFDYKFFSIKRKVLREFITLFVPRTLSVMTTQIDLTIDLMLATLLGAGSYTIFFFAQHLQLFPVSFVGMAFGQASLPYLSHLFKDGKVETIRRLFVNSILQLFYLSIPLSLFFIFARTPIVRIVFGGRKFDWAGTNLTALTMSIFAISIPAHTVFYFITRSFYAAHDTKTPFLINFFSVFVNASLSFYFIIIAKMPVWALALSFTISITLNVILLLIAFYSKINGYNLIKLFSHSVKIYITAIIASLGPYLVLKLFDELVIDTARSINVFILLVLVFSLYCISYLFFSWLFGVEEIHVFRKIIGKAKLMKKSAQEVYTEAG